ncbi:MAG TPA: hypothetical protein VFE58_16450 [Tepidisphaeraceae bacterium]|jgi:hypothetical protein|nr:hypothetical protein [Tepidisphaeraceae bacterium]
MADNKDKWVIILVAHEDENLEAQVIKECIPAEEDEQLAAFLRGGELIATLPDDTEADAESLRREIEKQCLR